MNSFFKSALTAAAFSVASASFAATPLIVSGGLAQGGNPTGPSYGGLTLANDFDGGGAYQGTLTGDFQIVPFNLVGPFLAPLNVTSGNYLAVPSAATSGSNPVGGYIADWTGFGTANAFGLYWGSPDYTNVRIDFLLGGTVVDTFSSLALPDQIAYHSNNLESAYVTFSGIAGGSFDALRFVGANSAWEMDNFSLALVPEVSAVPEPGEWAMMIAGLGVVSLIARRRKNQA
jgi:hypothetical protein